jgi:cytochrome c oxidase assembly protein subunit 11
MNAHKAPSTRNRATALALGAVALGMVGAAYASVPLYEVFCRVTGYGGTTQVASDGAETPRTVADRSITVRFDSNTAPELAWRFKPEQLKVTVKIGETGLAFYRATNTGDTPITGTATYNVTPSKAGIYFNKVECFCFTEQTLEPGQSVDMPVSFFVDPDIVNDPNLDDVQTITLSYTFFKAQDTDGRDEADGTAGRDNDDGDRNSLAVADEAARRGGTS